ncbi:uncharacterized protein LOC111135091 [Crassostrea virginica]
MSSPEPSEISSVTPENEPISSTAEHEPEPIAPEPEPGWPEPEPEWSAAYEEWGLAWPIHNYFFGCAFLLADIIAVCFLIRVFKSLSRKRKGSLSGALLVMLVLFCSLRFVCLIVDPYHTEQIFPKLCARLLWSLGSPFLLSAFSLVLLALIDTTKMSIGPPRFQKLSVILAFTGFYIVLVISADLSVFYAPETDPLLVICQGLFILFGAVMCVGYLYVAVKIRGNLSSSRGHIQHDNSGITRLIFTCYMSSVIGFSIIATHIYASSSVFGVYSDVKFVDAWSWWALQTLMRSEELAVVIVVICVAKRSLLPEDALKRLASCLMCWNKNNARARKVHVVPMDESTVGQTNTVNIESLSTNNESKRQHCR